jgi:hypothetical protein
MMETAVLPSSTPEQKPELFWKVLDDVEMDIRYTQHFAAARAKEVPLFKTKWFDYRRDHPLRSTYMFAQAYREAYRYMTAIRFDRDKAKYVKGFSGDDFLNLKGASGKSGFLRARIIADRYGIPYDFWCREAMRYAEDMSWSNMPRPAQLYSPEMINHILVRWEREQSVSLRCAEHPFYAPENFVDNPDQQQYQQYLINFIKVPASPMSQALRLATLYDRLTPGSLAGFDEQTMREAERLRDLFSQH